MPTFPKWSNFFNQYLFVTESGIGVFRLCLYNYLFIHLFVFLPEVLSLLLCVPACVCVAIPRIQVRISKFWTKIDLRTLKVLIDIMLDRPWYSISFLILKQFLPIWASPVHLRCFCKYLFWLSLAFKSVPILVLCGVTLSIKWPTGQLVFGFWLDVEMRPDHINCANAHGERNVSTNKWHWTWQLTAQRWLAGRVVDHIGIYWSKVADGFVAFGVALIIWYDFDHRSYFAFITEKADHYDINS